MDLAEVYEFALTYPKCLQATSASLLEKVSSHTVPHSPFMLISRRPAETRWVLFDSEISLMGLAVI